MKNHKLPTILTIIVLGLGILLVIGLRLADVIAKSVIDGQVTDILGVESRVGGVSLGVLTSNSSFSDITIKNPPGFEYEYILTVDRADIDCGVGTLLSNDIDIPNVLLTGLTFDLEQIDDQVNLEILIKHVNEYVKSLPSSTDETNLMIRELKVKNVRLRAKGKIVTLAGGKIDEKIPDFSVKNVGTKGDSSQLTSRFVSIITHVVIHQVFNHPIDGLVEPGPYILAFTILYSLPQKVFQRLLVKQVAKHIKNLALESCPCVIQLFQKTGIYLALARVLCHHVPQVTNLGLANPVDTTKPLLNLVGVPRQVIIDHQMTTLEVYTFAGSIIGDEHDQILVLHETADDFAAVFAKHPAMDEINGFGPSKASSYLVNEIQKRVFGLGKDNQLSTNAIAVNHQVIIENAVELAPFGVLA